MSRFFPLVVIVIFALGAVSAQPPALSSLPSAGSAPAGQGNFRVRLASGLTKPLADTLKKDVVGEGYPQVEVVEAGGSYSVLVGASQAEEQARSLLKDLRTAGFTPEQVVGAGDASAASTALPTGVPTTGEKVYRVQVGEFPSSAEAESGRAALRDENFSDVDVIAAGNTFKVLLGTFKQRDQAEKLLADVKNAGFSLAQVTDSEQRAIASGGAAEVASLPGAANLNATDRQEFQRITEMIDKQRSGDTTAEDVKTLQDLIRQQNDQIQQLLKQQATARDQSADVSNQVWQLYREFDSLLLSRRTDQAAQVLDRVRAIAPSEPSLPSKVKRLEQIRNGESDVAGGPSGGKGPDPERVQAAIAEARSAEASGDLSAAQRKYNEVLVLDPQNTEARGKIAEIASRQGAPEAAAAADNKNLMMYAAGGAVVLVLALLAYWQLVNARREKKLEQQVEQLTRGGAATMGAGTLSSAPTAAADQTFVDPLAPGGMYGGSSPASVTPAAGSSFGGASGLAGGMLGAGLEMPSMGNFNLLDEKEDESKKQEDTSPPVAPAPPEHTLSPAGESDMVSISGMDFDMSPTAPIAASTPPSGLATPTSNDSVNLDDMNFNFAPPPGGDLPLGESVSNQTPAGGLPDFNLDELLKGTFPGAASQSVGEETPAGPSARIQDITPVSLPGLGDIAAPPEQKVAEDDLRIQEVGSAGIAAGLAAGLGTAPTVQLPAVSVDSPVDNVPPAVAAPSSSGPAVHFEQTFDEESVGAQPSDWKGDYDYATLTVDDQSPAGGSGRCLKFEKRSGAGSAGYHCKFPNASGMVTIDFDIRCDDKNKYLLGFYIEKDEDFKQSVHTIVHRIDSRSQPSLRIQGEPVPYELGTWRHVRYELNLLMGMVNAYVNDEHVVKDAKLPTIPSYVNTLSIRDNLATTGVLYLDNIRITRK